MYRILKEINAADTWRDPDNICTTELGCTEILEEAKSIANEYIKNKFFSKDVKLRELEDGSFYACDFCSYGVSLHIILIE